MNRRMLFGSGTPRALVLACLVLLSGLLVAAPRSAHAQASPVTRAQQQYDAGQFSEALATVLDALSSGAVTGSDAVAARELLARCQAKTGDVAAARRTFLQILGQDPQYRLDEVRTPPDEMAVFRAALQLFEEQQAQQRRRLPASLTFSYGIGSGANEDMGEYVAQGGGDKSFEVTPSFGLGVRFPLAPRWSLDLELQRLRATNEDTLTVTGSGHGSYELTATPAIVSIVYLVHDGGRFRASVFAGGGPMLNSYAADKFLLFASIPIKTTDTKVGTYVHGGLEGEYVMSPRLSLTARALFRSASATKLYKGSTFSQYGTGTEPIGDRDLDFTGFGLYAGLRGYIGY